MTTTTKTVTDKHKKENNVKDSFKQRYKKIKLLPEHIFLIKKALINYKTSELEVERITTLAQFSHDDYFLVMYVANKRERKHKEQQMHFPTIMASVKDSERVEKEKDKKETLIPHSQAEDF